MRAPVLCRIAGCTLCADKAICPLCSHEAPLAGPKPGSGQPLLLKRGEGPLDGSTRAETAVGLRAMGIGRPSETGAGEGNSTS
jgi:hypothetical protein